MRLQSTAVVACLWLAPVVAWTCLSPTRTTHRGSPLAVATEDDRLEELLAASTPSNNNNRVEEASQTIDELTDAFLGEDLDVDDFLAAIESEVGRVETEPSPRVLTGVDQAVAIAREGAAIVLRGVTAVAQESADLVETLPTTKVGNKDDSVTYGEAFDKLGKGAQGLFALASAFGGFVKETVEHEIEERQTRMPVTKALLSVEDFVPLEEVPNESLSEEELSDDGEEDDGPKGINPSLLSNFLQQLKEAQSNIQDEVEVEIQDEPAEETPNPLAFFLSENKKN